MFWRAVLSALAIAATSVEASVPPPGATQTVLPDRMLRCTVGRAIDFQPNSDQKWSEIKREGSSQFHLFLPSAPAKVRLDDVTADADDPSIVNVHPRTGIVADPEGLAPRPLASGSAASVFTRVADYWPERVELSYEVSPSEFFIVLVSDISTTARTSQIFMAVSNSELVYDPKRIYLGSCRL